MKIETHTVIVKTVHPNGKLYFVEVARLMLLPITLYERELLGTDEVSIDEGWLTVIGSKIYLVSRILPEHIEQEGTVGYYHVIVGWDDLETQPEIAE